MTSKTIKIFMENYFYFTPLYSKKYLITSVVVTIPTKSSPSHTGKSMKFVFDKIEAVSLMGMAKHFVVR
jgi:hypothetical protein